ncbi:Retinoid isomerohydrolase [Cercospora beticola]|uniref:Retinoid isomerohydrolase n=1 Tax=Cercospora beticola TaxID=122368 RepID=A0A2G5HMY4_CERBT|nr:Retinoid isomerohydrolase [Cercospora beticola]PIA93926.1 Retinoid isomerohydrolase [Cercospora beticola]WPB02020.1 hypothetical protein RHO25_006654 [Cercospora beticola]
MTAATQPNSAHYREWPNAGAFNALGDTRSKIKLEIQGHFPTYAAGALYRTGPGGYKVPRDDPKDGDFAVQHWFDGFTTSHRFEMVRSTLEDKKCSEIWYNSYCQVDEEIEHVRKTGKLDQISFGQKRDPCDGLYKKFKAVFEPQATKTPHSANIGVVVRAALPCEMPENRQGPKRADSPLGDQQLGDPAPPSVLCLTTDTSAAKTFDAETLEPLGVTRQTVLHPELKGQLSAAHAARDPQTGEVFNYNLEFGPKTTYRVFGANPQTGEVRILAKIPHTEAKPAYIHSMFCTPNFVILCVWSAHFKQPYGLNMLWTRNVLDTLDNFDANSQSAAWLVIDRHHGRGVVKKFTSPAFFAFHTTNAWEERRAGNSESVDITCELFEFENKDILDKFYYQNLVSNEKSTELFNDSREQIKSQLARYELADIPLNGKAAAKHQVDSAVRILTVPSSSAGDLQQCNPEYRMKPHRYVWSVLDRGKSSFLDGLCKTDVETKTALIWEKPRHTPGEPIFIPAPRALAEDEGCVLSVGFDGDSGASYLLCLDAQTMEEVGRAEVGRPVGFGFHGAHVPAAVGVR